jgi:hypothetical protein
VAQFDRAIPPGGEGKVTLKVDLKGYQGSVRKSATVDSNDPQNPRSTLVLQGNVKPLIEVQPSGSIIFRGMADQMEEKTVSLTSTKRQFAIQKVESNLDDKIRYRVETVEAGKHYRLKITNLLKQGNYNGVIKCYTDMPEKSEIQIRVSGYVEGDVSVKPLMVLIGKLSAQQPVRTGKVLVVSNRKKPFQIKQLTYDETLVEVKQEPLPNDSGYSLEITPKVEALPAAVGGRSQTVLTIQTDVQSDEPQQVQIHIVNSSETKETGASGSPQASPVPPQAPKSPPQ